MDLTTTTTTSSSSGQKSGKLVQLPIACSFRSDLGLFRIIRSRGRTLAAGGFGLFLRDDEDDSNDKSPSEEQQITTTSQQVVGGINEEPKLDSCEKDADESKADIETEPVVNQNTDNGDGEEDDMVEDGMTADEIAEDAREIIHSKHHLFIEEVIFLHERGLLEAYNDENDSGKQEVQEHERKRLDLYDLFNLLPICNLSVPSYLVYAHLRSQTFRVIRHTPRRRTIIDQMEIEIRRVEDKLKEIEATPEENKSEAEKSLNRKKLIRNNFNIKALRKQLREDLACAPIPTLCTYETNEMQQQKPTILYDAYNPNSLFSSSRPGLPDFYVAATYFNREKALKFPEIVALINEADGIPLKIATVADGGTVVMFGVTDFGVPVYNGGQPKSSQKES